MTHAASKSWKIKGFAYPSRSLVHNLLARVHQAGQIFIEHVCKALALVPGESALVSLNGDKSWLTKRNFTPSQSSSSGSGRIVLVRPWGLSISNFSFVYWPRRELFSRLCFAHISNPLYPNISLLLSKSINIFFPSTECSYLSWALFDLLLLLSVFQSWDKTGSVASGCF